jgi:hypothetical protein
MAEQGTVERMLMADTLFLALQVLQTSATRVSKAIKIRVDNIQKQSTRYVVTISGERTPGTVQDFEQPEPEFLLSDKSEGVTLPDEAEELDTPASAEGSDSKKRPLEDESSDVQESKKAQDDVKGKGRADAGAGPAGEDEMLLDPK